MPVLADETAGWKKHDDLPAYPTAFAVDQHGHIWIASEDKGVFRSDSFAAESGGFRQFDAKSGLLDHTAYSICCDSAGRIWVGTLNHGVSVYSGTEWRNYGVLEGPGGERVFDIACSPKDGDVWIASNAGLCRYSQANDNWSLITTKDGLPSSCLSCLAFDSKGTLYVGTQTEGIAIGKIRPDGVRWQHLPGPARMPIVPVGSGLPSGLINDILVNANDEIFVATTVGLAMSRNGSEWTFLRGRDYVNKVRGLFGGAPRGWKPVSNAELAKLLPEDYISSLAEGKDGTLWLGFRRQGVMAYDFQSGTQVLYAPTAGPKKDEKTPPDQLNDYAKSIGVSPTGAVWVAQYRDGVRSLPKPPELASKSEKTKRVRKTESQRASKGFAGSAKLPTPAKAPSQDDLAALLKGLEEAPANPKNRFVATPLEDDWTSQGDWLDRYGENMAVLCAMAGHARDYRWGSRSGYFDYRSWLGRNFLQKDDSLRYWVHWVKTDNVRTLQNIVSGGRKEAEWDDHGEVYDFGLDGPHVYATLKFPRGHYIASFYFFNKDGHTGNNRFRDYLLELRATPLDAEHFDKLGRRIKTRNGSIREIEAEAKFLTAEPGTPARVRDFWGGVYKRFYVNVPDKDTLVTVRVSRNNSFNTILCGLFIDPVGSNFGYRGPKLEPVHPRRSQFATVKSAPEDGAEATLRLLDGLLTIRDANPQWYAENSRSFLLPTLRSLMVAENQKACLASEIESTGRYSSLRTDMAVAVGDLGLFRLRDAIHTDPLLRESYIWSQITALGGRPKKITVRMYNEFAALAARKRDEFRWNALLD